MSEPSAFKRNMTPLNIFTALVLGAGVIFMLQQPNKTATAVAAEKTESGLFTLSGKTYQSSDLSLRFGQPLHQVELESYRRKLQIAQAAALDLYIQQQAEKEGKTAAEVAQTLFTIEPPSDEQLQAFYDANRASIQGEFTQVKPEIANYLNQLQQQAQQQALIQKLVTLKELSFNLTPPEAPTALIDTQGFPAKGPSDAKVTLVEFADYQCPHCKQAHQLMKRLLTPYLDRVRFVYMDFPINRSGISRAVAEGAVCADQQGKFWDYSDRAFEQQGILSADSPLRIAAELKLDQAAFDTCLADHATADKVRRAEAQAIKAGATATPSFFLNGEKLEMHDLRRELPLHLDRALQAAGLTTQG